ncbi:MAG: type II toxin-antitoxin system VapC family toxin [Verrucomicrobia bacterium]|nr:type II toxin-antitoxin system VapC family toxin [Verrucomicrobiota bacterium]
MARLKYLLDTHAFLWAAIDEDRLSLKAARAIALTPYEQLAISDVTLQEVGLLLHAGRISFTGSPATVLGSLLHYVTVLPITLEIALAAPALALPHGDQFDRIIAATAKKHRLPLITNDANITDAGVVDTFW